MKWTWIRDHKRVIKVVVGCGLVIYIGYYVVVTRYTAGLLRSIGIDNCCILLPVRELPSDSLLVSELNAFLMGCFYPLWLPDHLITGMHMISVPHNLLGRRPSRSLNGAHYAENRLVSMIARTGTGPRQEFQRRKR